MTKGKTRALTATAVFAALICVLAPWGIPIGAVPLSLATLAVYLAGGALGWKRGSIATAVYLLLGAVGLPVFSGFAGGAQQLLGVTGGFLWGYLPCAFLTGLFADRFGRISLRVLGMLLGTVVLYAVGTAYFCFLTQSTVRAALGICVLPFLPGDAVKIAAAALLCERLRRLWIRLA